MIQISNEIGPLGDKPISNPPKTWTGVTTLKGKLKLYKDLQEKSYNNKGPTLRLTLPRGKNNTFLRNLTESRVLEGERTQPVQQ